MTDFSTKEMDTFYSALQAMMTYVESQSRAFARLNPWMMGSPQACPFSKNVMEPIMTAMGMTSLTEFRALEEKSAELAKRLETALQEIEAHRRTIETHLKTIADQAEHVDSLTRLNGAEKARLETLEKDLGAKDKWIAAQEKKLAAASASLEEKKKTVALHEKELKKQSRYSEQMEKEIAGLKSYIESIEKTSS
ncbi:hypothetical protein [Desulfococcus sp.]|uniref:hypothetical protein n=1 Tax=Desulfococcus sp. TaxID=2025834 RepID=UPI003593E293